MNKERMQHIMIDLETLSTSPNAAIISIGAVMFDLEGSQGTGAEFYFTCDWQSSAKGRDVSMSTIKWWFGQSQEARQAAVMPARGDLKDALQELCHWIGENAQDPIVWGNGSTFDITILENALQQYSIQVPWKFYNVRDCRTIEALTRGTLDRDAFKRDGTHHNALDDAKYQATYITGMWQAAATGLRGTTDVMPDPAPAAAADTDDVDY